jgi:hypothetical protein
MARRGDGIRSIARSRVLGAVLGAAVALAPMQASAECAWVLWHRVLLADGGGVSDAPINAFATKQECNVNRQDTEQDISKKLDPAVSKELLVCLPDTVDPRGPKGGAR